MRIWIFRLLSACTIVAACLACTSAAPGARPAPTPAPAGPNDTLARIHALVGTPNCSNDSECHSLPLGARACGGPEGYLAWSSRRTSRTEIEVLGARYEAERRAANLASGRISTCQFMADPGAVCRAGSCQPGAGTQPLPAR